MGESSATCEYVEADVTIMDSDTGGDDDPGQNGSDEPGNGSGNEGNGNEEGIKFPMGPKQD